jgi:hypothetical protein
MAETCWSRTLLEELCYIICCVHIIYIAEGGRYVFRRIRMSRVERLLSSCLSARVRLSALIPLPGGISVKFDIAELVYETLSSNARFG